MTYVQGKVVEQYFKKKRKLRNSQKNKTRGTIHHSSRRTPRVMEFLTEPHKCSIFSCMQDWSFFSRIQHTETINIARMPNYFSHMVRSKNHLLYHFSFHLNNHFKFHSAFWSFGFAKKKKTINPPNSTLFLQISMQVPWFQTHTYLLLFQQRATHPKQSRSLNSVLENTNQFFQVITLRWCNHGN